MPANNSVQEIAQKIRLRCLLVKVLRFSIAIAEHPHPSANLGKSQRVGGTKKSCWYAYTDYGVPRFHVPSELACIAEHARSPIVGDEVGSSDAIHVCSSLL